MSSFQRPVGAMADVKELEYISALHQTGATLRADGSIQDEDIRLYLSSRYGVEVSVETVRNTILKGLGCVNDDRIQDGRGEIDLMELMAILLIPTLLKSSAVQNGNEVKDGLLLPPPDMIQFALSVVLHDATGNHTPKQLNVELLRKIFEAYGEVDYAADTALLQSMVDCCTEPGQTANLTVDTFCRALTHDVDLYDFNNEVRESTHVQDVFEVPESESDSERPNNNDEETPAVDKKIVARSLHRHFTAAAIDSTAGTYRSKGLAILIWAATLITFFVDIYSEGRESAAEICSDSNYEYVLIAPWRSNRGALLCEMGLSITLWLMFFIIFSLFGLTMVGLGSIGNDVHCKKWWVPLVGSFFISVATIPGFVGKLNDSKASVKYLSIVSFMLGLTAATMHVLHSISMVIPKQWLEKYEALKSLLRSSTILGEMDLKRASSRKVHGMLRNAIAVVERHEKESILNTHFSQAMFNFPSFGVRQTENVGSMRWTWRNLANRKLFRKEGLWYSVRLSASNLAQAFITLYVMIEGSRWVKHVESNFDSEATKEQVASVVDRVIDSNVDDALIDSFAGQMSEVVATLLVESQNEDLAVNCSSVAFSVDDVITSHCSVSEGVWQCDESAEIDYLCALLDESSGVTDAQALALLDASGLDGDALVEISRNWLQKSADQAVNSLYPTHKYMVTIPATVAVVVASMCALYLTLGYASSVTCTILKLRCGVIPTLTNPRFARMRAAPDSVSLLTGSLFWGCLGSSLLVGGFVGLLVFLFLWQGSIYFAQRLTALSIGILVIALTRILVVNCCRKKYYQAFYRRRPGAANLALLALEWANFALSAGFIIARTLKLLLVAGFSIGRIDRPFLAEGIGAFGPIELDGYPTIHTRDLLLQEAHRHPYLELLGTMYLMKLRHADHFGKTAGSCWRLIFVYALFPWLHRYRVMARPKLFEDAVPVTGSSHPESDLRNKTLNYVSLRNMFAATLSDEKVDSAARPSVLASIEKMNACAPLDSIREVDDPVTMNRPDVVEPDDDQVDKCRIKQLEAQIALLQEELQNIYQRESAGSSTT